MPNLRVTLDLQHYNDYAAPHIGGNAAGILNSVAFAAVISEKPTTFRLAEDHLYAVLEGQDEMAIADCELKLEFLKAKLNDILFEVSIENGHPSYGEFSTDVEAKPINPQFRSVGIRFVPA